MICLAISRNFFDLCLTEDENECGAANVSNLFRGICSKSNAKSTEISLETINDHMFVLLTSTIAPNTNLIVQYRFLQLQLCSNSQLSRISSKVNFGNGKNMKTENNLQRTEPKSLILFNLQFALTNLVLIRGVGQLQQVLSPLLVFCAVLGLPLELRLHQPLLALGVGARL